MEHPVRFQDKKLILKIEAAKCNLQNENYRNKMFQIKSLTFYLLIIPLILIVNLSSQNFVKESIYYMFGTSYCILDTEFMGYQILWLPWGYLRGPPRYQGRSHFRPHITIEHLLLGKLRGHMPNFGLKSKKIPSFLKWYFASH